MERKVETYPVDFVQVIGLENDSADNTLTWSGLHLDFDIAKENVKVGRENRSIVLLSNGDSCTLAGVGNPGLVCGCPLSVVTFGKIGIETRARQTRV